MKFYAGVTDNDWFNFLAGSENEDVNFWQPSGRTNFKALSEGDPFVFKLKKPANAIGGVGFFSSHSILPLDVAWDIFGARNGLSSYLQFKNKIVNYRSSGRNSFANNPNIGCIVLTDPIFFDRQDWIPIPRDWKNSIVQGKGYSTDDAVGREVWQQVQEKLTFYQSRQQPRTSDKDVFNSIVLEEPGARYGKPTLIKPRLGQGAFRVQVTDSYNRKCSITGEKTLPALEAAHVKPHAESGPNHITNGILLRADIHKLYDAGYLTLTTDYKIEVSRKIKEEFHNGKDYYKHHGTELLNLPADIARRPGEKFIEWHNQNIYNG